MSGLILKLTAGERLVINGAILEIKEPTRMRIADSKVNVLRLRDALKPEDVDTPVKQIYYAVQLIITQDIDKEEALPAIDAECCKLLDVFATIDPDMVPRLRSMIGRGNYYSAMCLLRQIITIEARLLAHCTSTAAAPVEIRVA